MDTLTPPQPATIADLYRVLENGKAEIIEALLVRPRRKAIGARQGNGGFRHSNG